MLRKIDKTSFAVSILCSLTLLLAPCAMSVGAQTCKARMDQDSTHNNLIHPAGYETCKLGELGKVTKVGLGPKQMVLIAGAGFGGDIFQGFMDSRQLEYTMFAVTIAGNAGSPAPPFPTEGTSYAKGTWTRGAEQGVLDLIEREGLNKPVIVAHWYFATQVALRLAIDYPDKVGGVVIISGVARFESADTVNYPAPKTTAERAAYVDRFMAPRWFKTVTYDTWHDNNWRPMDYASHPLDQLILWREAAEPPLPVWIRFVCEVWAQDITTEFNKLRVPILIVKPGLDQCYLDANPQSYLAAFTQKSWDGVEKLSEYVNVKTVENSRVFIMYDQPQALDVVVDKFLSALESEIN